MAVERQGGITDPDNRTFEVVGQSGRRLQMQVANGVYELVERWAVEQRRKVDGGLGYGQSCLAGLGEGKSVVHALLPRGVHDLAGAFLLVDRVLAVLNPLVAETIRWLYVDRFSQVQIARRHGCSDRTVRNRLNEGMVRIQEAWMLGDVDDGFYSVKKSA